LIDRIAMGIFIAVSAVGKKCYYPLPGAQTYQRVTALIQHKNFPLSAT
jgi:hypothetical protein